MEAFEYLAKSCSEALAGITAEDRETLVSRILTGKRIFVFGVGRSGLVGQTFAIRLVQLGLQVYFVGDMTTPIIGKDDVMILISNTGSTMSVVKTAEIAQRLGNFDAYGPILLGLNAPINDLSRGCNGEEVYSMAIITAALA